MQTPTAPGAAALALRLPHRVEDALADAFERAIGAAEMIELGGQRVLRVRVLAAAALQDQLHFDVVALPLIEVDDGRARPEVVAGVLAGDRVDGVGPQLAAPRRLGDRLADLLPQPDLVGADRHLDLERRHARVLADRPFAACGLVDVLRDDRQRLARARRRLLGRDAPVPIAARTSGGRSVEVFMISWTMLSRKCGSMRSSIIRGSGMQLRASSAILSASVRVPADGVLRRADAARGRELPHQRPHGAARPRHRHRADQEGRGAKPTARSAGSPPTSPARSSRAADEVLAGRLRDQFVVDVYQAGAGTSHNMNANEVLANRAAELLGGARGELHARAPERSRQHGPVHQRRVPDGDAAGAAGDACRWLRPRRAQLAAASKTKAAQFAQRPQDRPHAPAGRRADHARPGVRRLCGQRRARRATTSTRAAEQLLELNLGATAVGTGLNAGDDYTQHAIATFSRVHGDCRCVPRANRFRVTQSMGDVLAVSGALRRLAVEVGKVASRPAAAQHGAARRASPRSSCRPCSRDRPSCPAR